MTELFDTHAHLNQGEYEQDLSDILRRAQEAGVKLAINVGYNLASSRSALAIAATEGWLPAAVGVHPHDAGELTDDGAQVLLDLAVHPRVVALGEIGLDYYRDLSPRELQREAFTAQLEMARELELPVIIHDREAHGDVLKILKEHPLPRGGVMHCFSGSWELAEEVLKLGFYISFAGPLTYKNSRRLGEVAARVPQDRLLIETDSPYLSPEPRRGRPNEPANVRFVAEKLAEIRGLDGEETAALTYQNACRLFCPGTGL